MKIIGYTLAVIVSVALLLAAAYGLGWFGVEAERTIIQNSRQYIISQQRHLVDLAADCADLDTKIVETDNQDLIATYERQQAAIDRQMDSIAVTLDPSDIPAAALGGCR